MRDKGIVASELLPFFSLPLAAIRKVKLQRCVTKRCAEVRVGTVQKNSASLGLTHKVTTDWVLPTEELGVHEVIENLRGLTLLAQQLFAASSVRASKASTGAQVKPWETILQ